jgi:hypothetical protein
MLPNYVSETHAESGDPLILDEAETGPLIPFKLVCADFGIGRRTGGRRVPLPDSWSTIHHGELLGINPDDKLICINYGDDLTHILARKTRQLVLSPLSKMMIPKDHSRQKGGGFDHDTKGGQRDVTTVGDIAGFYTDLILINEATNYGPRQT